MHLLKNILAVSLFCSVAAMQSGCSISYSVEKSSDSVSTSFDSLTSISTSSSGGEEKKVTETATVYEEDVAAVTVLYASREKNNEEYQRQISRIAGSHGIGDWEQEAATFEGMGMGLRRAGVDKNSIATMPYFSSLAGSAQFDLVMKGYHL